MDLISQGIAADCQLQGFIRDARDGEAGFEGRVAVLVLTPQNGAPIDLMCRPADTISVAVVNETLGVVCRALGHAAVERIKADAALIKG